MGFVFIILISRLELRITKKLIASTNNVIAINSTFRNFLQKKYDDTILETPTIKKASDADNASFAVKLGSSSLKIVK
jgi:hypothetical protein